MPKQAVVINPKDNVATVVNDFSAQTVIHFFIDQTEHSVQLLQDIPLGHKIAIREIKAGQAVIKYAESIGLATETIQPGQHVHVHNMETQRGRRNQEEA